MATATKTKRLGEKEGFRTVPKWGVRLVKEEGYKYDSSRPVDCPDAVRSLLEQYFQDLDREHFATIHLDRKGGVLGINTVSIGGLFTSIAHPREVFKPAIILGTSSLILAHNHPSGDPEPSKEDLGTTKRLVECGELLGIEILDHIILGDNGRYCSFKSRGLI